MQLWTIFVDLIKGLGGGGLAGTLVQLPVFLGLYAAVRRGLSGSARFLWIENLMKPDPLLAGVCAVLSGLAAFLGSQAPENHRAVQVLLPMVLTFLFLSRMAAGVTIYSFASGLVGVLQSVLVWRRLMRLAA